MSLAGALSEQGTCTANIPQVFTAALLSKEEVVAPHLADSIGGAIADGGMMVWREGVESFLVR